MPYNIPYRKLKALSMIVHTDAKLSLHGYKQWRSTLKALPVGTVVGWVKGYTGLTLDTTIKAGQHYKVSRVRGPIAGCEASEADMVYEMVLVSKSGKEFKHKVQWRVESIAAKLHHGECFLLENS